MIRSFKEFILVSLAVAMGMLIYDITANIIYLVAAVITSTGGRGI